MTTDEHGIDVTNGELLRIAANLLYPPEDYPGPPPPRPSPARLRRIQAALRQLADDLDEVSD